MPHRGRRLLRPYPQRQHTIRTQMNSRRRMCPPQGPRLWKEPSTLLWGCEVPRTASGHERRFGLVPMMSGLPRSRPIGDRGISCHGPRTDLKRILHL